MNKTTNKSMKEIINHLKEKGFIFQGSEIYSGLANSWDFGPLGVLLKNNIKKAWWDFFITKSEYNVGLESSIILNPKVWQVSGHLDNFSDPLIDCKKCKTRFRVDNLLNHYYPDDNFDNWTNEQLKEFLQKHHPKCLKCNSEDWTPIRQFQLMFESYQSVLKEEKNKIYLRPEIAQGIFINFNNVKNAFNKKLPFGIGQIGKSFRNEITPGNFIFRTREFEQMELEFFFLLQGNNASVWFDYWLEQCKIFINNLGLENISFKKHDKSKLAHYALATTDIEYDFPFGTSELCGIANRGDFDLKNHSISSGVSLEIQDPTVTTKKMVIPAVIEPSMGVERLLLALICEAFSKENNDGKERLVLKLNHVVAPYQVAVIPLHKSKLRSQAHEIFTMLNNSLLRVVYGEASNIGKAYNYQDSIGTIYCVTIDYDSVNKETVTVRHRDTMKQEIVLIKELKVYLYQQLNICY